MSARIVSMVMPICVGIIDGTSLAHEVGQEEYMVLAQPTFRDGRLLPVMVRSSKDILQ